MNNVHSEILANGDRNNIYRYRLKFYHTKLLNQIKRSKETLELAK